MMLLMMLLLPLLLMKVVAALVVSMVLAAMEKVRADEHQAEHRLLNTPSSHRQLCRPPRFSVSVKCAHQNWSRLIAVRESR
jgi:hypothetical protein